MDAATIQARITRGYAIAGSKLGLPHDLYRPTNPLAPLAPSAKVATLPAAFSAEPNLRFDRASEYGDAMWYPLLDATLVQTGDYVVGPSGTFFLPARQALLPMLAVQCNRTVAVHRPAGAPGFGAQPYGGSTAGTETVLMAGWPASVLLKSGSGGGATGNGVGLPGDAGLAATVILLPAVPGIPVRNADLVLDDLGNRYVVGGAELTDLGWRLIARQAAT